MGKNNDSGCCHVGYCHVVSFKCVRVCVREREREREN